jgi:flagellar FliL protein
MAQDQAAPQKPAPKSKKKLIIIVIVLLLVAIGGAAYFMLHNDPKSKDAHQKEKEVQVKPSYLPFGPFAVNLQPVSDEKYLQISLTIQASDTNEEEILKSHTPEIQDRIELLISSKQPSDISTTEGKVLLKNELITRINMPFRNSNTPQKISDVFFTNFIIQ